MSGLADSKLVQSAPEGEHEEELTTWLPTAKHGTADRDASAGSSSLFYNFGSAPVRTALKTGLPFSCSRIAAPMVGASDLPFRMLCRRHGADAAYTQMLLAADVVGKSGYAKEMLRTCEGDRPLIVQLAGDNPAMMLQAAKLVQPYADAVDINLGCPQEKAKLEHYGAYLSDRKDWPLVYDIVNTLASHLSVPTFCKIRLQESEEATIAFAKLLQDAGCALLTVHGRRRGSDRKRRVGPADLAAVSKVVGALSIPVITNGNVETHADVHACITLTGAQGVMSAEGLLRNPAIFQCHCSESTAAVELPTTFIPTPSGRLQYISEYLDLIEETGCVLPSPDLSIVNLQNHIGWFLGKEGHGKGSVFRVAV